MRTWPPHIIPSPEWQGLNQRQSAVIGSIWSEIDALKRAIRVPIPAPKNPVVQTGGGGGGGTAYPPGFQPLGAANTVLGVDATGSVFEYKTLAVQPGHLTVAFAAGSVTTGLPNVGTAGTYGSATQTPVLTTDAQGRITAVTPATISGTVPGGSAGGDLTGTYPNPGVGKVQGQAWKSGTPSDAQIPVWVNANSDWEPKSLSGDASLANSGALTLANTAVSAGSYGGATHAPSFTVDAKGRLTAAASNLITGVNGNAFPGAVALGDMLYGSAAGTLSKLAGNASSTQKLLTQTGTGSVSAAPAWLDPAALACPPAWSSAVTYAPGNLVQGSDGNLYRAIASSTNADPTADANVRWEAFWITQSITLNVATSGSRFSQIGGVGVAGTAWAFIQNAFIGQNATVTISVASGTYNIAVRWAWNHVQGNQIAVTGAGSATTILNFTGTTLTTAGVLVNTGNVCGAISGLAFQGATSHSGAANGTIGLLANSGGTIIVNSDLAVARFDTGLEANTRALIACNAGSLSVSECRTVAILSNNGSNIACQAATVTTIGTSGGGMGYSAQEGSFIYAQGSSATSCLGSGYDSERNSTINAGAATATSCGNGFFATDGGWIRAPSSVANKNTTGWNATYGGRINTTGNAPGTGGNANTANYNVDGGTARDTVSAKAAVIQS